MEVGKECCGNCRYGSYELYEGYVCLNDESEYCADYTEHDFVCEEYESKADV